MEQEIWKDIEGYEGLYQVNNLGTVKSIGKYNLANRNRSGYAVVNLYKNKKYKTFSLHRLVALSFIPNPENKSQVNHINGVKTDNRVENLEWCTASENIKHAYDIGIKKVLQNNNFINNPPMLGKKGNLCMHAKAIYQYSKLGIIICKWGSIVEAGDQLNIHKGNISLCCNGKRKSAGNFKWKFI